MRLLHYSHLFYVFAFLVVSGTIFLINEYGNILTNMKYHATYIRVITRTDESKHTKRQGVNAEEYELIGNQLYIRDYLGFLYQKGYFDTVPAGPESIANQARLSGQHKDVLLPACNFSKKVNRSPKDQKFGLIEPMEFLRNYKNPCWKEKGTLYCIPYFYLIGMAKSGSSDLFNRINQHPHVKTPLTKEPRWFCSGRFAGGEKSDIRHYTSYFQEAIEGIKNTTDSSGYHSSIFGDGSPSYSWDNIEWQRQPENKYCLEPRTTVMSNIHHVTPTAKLILILRNPADRLYSHYLFHGNRNGAARNEDEFHKWAETTIAIYRQCYKISPFRSCMYSKSFKNVVKMTSLTSSLYSRLLLDILKIFPREQLLILETSDYGKNLKQRLKMVYKFLELEPLSDIHLDEVASTNKSNTGIYYDQVGPMLGKTRKMLNDFFKPFNEELAYMLKNEIYLWHDK